MSQDMDRLKAKERYAAGKMRQHSTRALFFIGGFGAASWAPLVPLLRERLAIGEDELRANAVLDHVHASEASTGG